MLGDILLELKNQAGDTFSWLNGDQLKYYLMLWMTALNTYVGPDLKELPDDWIKKPPQGSKFEISKFDQQDFIQLLILKMPWMS